MENIKIETNPEMTIVTVYTNLVGEAVCDEIFARVSDAEPSFSRPLLFDLGNCRYMSSAGVAMLIKLLTKSKVNNQNFALCNLNQNSKELFAITQLERVFQMFDNREAAEKHLLVA